MVPQVHTKRQGEEGAAGCWVEAEEAPRQMEVEAEARRLGEEAVRSNIG